MKKNLLTLFMTALFIITALMPSNYLFALPQSVRVIFNYAKIYQTTQIYELNKDQLDELTITVALLHEVFEVEGEEDEFYKVKVDDETFGYILKICVIDNSVSSPKKYLQTNAIVITNAPLYEKISDEFAPAQRILNKDTRVKLLSGFDKARPYTYIAFEENDQLYFYHIETQNLNPDGLDRTVLIAISLILTTLSLGPILLKILKKNKKYKLENKK